MHKANSLSERAKTPSKRSADRGGISTGGTYLRVDKIERLRRLLRLQGLEGGDEQIRSLAGELFTFTDGQAEQVLFQREFKVAAALAFPEHAQAIEDLYQIALRNARVQRQEPDLRPREAVREKLLLQEVSEFYESLLLLERGERDRIDVQLRLASVIYYAVQAFVHNVRLAVQSNEQAITLDEAVKAFREIVQRSCEQANRSVRAAFESAVRKFGYRSLAPNIKNLDVERRLMEGISD
jgi:hypothetical protein